MGGREVSKVDSRYWQREPRGLDAVCAGKTGTRETQGSPWQRLRGVHLEMLRKREWRMPAGSPGSSDLETRALSASSFMRLTWKEVLKNGHSGVPVVAQWKQI